MHTDTTDGFHVTSERERYAKRLNDTTWPSKPGSASTSGASCGTSVKARLIGKPLSSERTGSSPGAPIMRLAVMRCRERIELGVGPVLQDGLEETRDQLGGEVFGVLATSLAVVVVEPTGID